jgi:hypothetical protein
MLSRLTAGKSDAASGNLIVNFVSEEQGHQILHRIVDSHTA